MVTTIPNTSLKQGWNDFNADTEFSYDRWGQPQNVRIEDPTTGQFRALQPGESVPAGARFSIYTSQEGGLAGSPGPSAGGQETTTGQDLVWQNHQISMDLLNAQDRMRQLDQADQQIQQQHAQFQANLQQQRDIAQMDAQQNAAQIGVQAAQQQLQAKLAQLDNEARAAEHNFNQRLSQVQEERAAERLNLDRSIARSNQMLSAEQLNADQRTQLAQLQQQGLQMLADRSGPQDWTKYQYLQENMLSPDAEGSTQVNPFKMLQDFYQPYEPDLKGLEEEYQPNLGGLVQEYQPGSTGGEWQGTLQDAVGQAQSAGGLLGGAPQVQVPMSTRMGGNDPYQQPGQQPPAGGQIPYGNDNRVNEIPASQGIPNARLEPGRNLVTVPEGAGIGYDRFDPRFDVYAHRDGEYVQLGPGDTAQGGSPIWINTPQDYNPSGEPQPMQMHRSPPQQVVPPGDMQPYGNDNRTFDAGDDYNWSTGQPTQVSPFAGPKGGQVFGPSVDNAPSGGGGISYGDDQKRYSIGSGAAESPFAGPKSGQVFEPSASQNSYSGGSSVSAPTVESGAQLNDRQRRMMSRYNQMRQMNTGGNLLDGQMAIVGDKPNGRTGYEEAIINTPQGTRVLDRHQTKGLLDGSPRRMNTGGLLQSQDVGSADPDAFTFNQYSDEDLYNQPFLQQVRGERQGRGFGAFGGGNRVGPFDLPTTPSMGTLSSLSPSALKMTQGAYEDPRTGQYWDDVMDRARRASIGTQSTGGMSAFAGYR